MRRQKKFYAWGYADEDLSAEEIKYWEQGIAKHYGVSSFDVRPPPKPDEITLRAPRVSVPSSLQEIVRTDHLTRLEHSYGKAGFDACRMFMRSVPNPPDAIAFPKDEDDVVRVLAWCDQIGAKAIPYGGGSSVVKGIEPQAEFEKVVTISMREMDQVLEVDPVSSAARIQGGIYGPAIEDHLRDTPFTMRHYMQAYRCSTLGGWIATRSGGHYASLYTHIDDFVESTRMVTPAGTLQTRRLPGSGAGPSPDRLVIGSEGILGVIVEAWMRLQDRPVHQASASVSFASMATATLAVRALSQSGLFPTNCRLLDAAEAKNNGVGDGTSAVLVLGFESADHALAPWMARALELVGDHGGQFDAEAVARSLAPSSGSQEHRQGPAGRWRNAFIRMPYYRDHVVAMGVITDTFETAITWDRFENLYDGVREKTLAAIRKICGQDAGISCRFTHIYPDGPAD